MTDLNSGFLKVNRFAGFGASETAVYVIFVLCLNTIYPPGFSGFRYLHL